MRMPIKLKIQVDGSGTAETAVVNEPDCEVVKLLPEVKSAAVHTPLGQKYSWMFWGEGVIPFGRS
jgi:hypothetical protein